MGLRREVQALSSGNTFQTHTQNRRPHSGTPVYVLDLTALLVCYTKLTGIITLNFEVPIEPYNYFESS